MQPLIVSKNPIFDDIASIERCCVNSDWSRAALLTRHSDDGGEVAGSNSSGSSGGKKRLFSLVTVGFPAGAPILLSERTDAPPPTHLLKRNAVSDLCWCAKDPVLYCVADDGMTLFCYSFDQQQQQQQQQQQSVASSSAAAQKCEFALPLLADDMAWAAAIPAEIVEAACLSTSYNRDEPTPVTSDAAAPALANMSFGSDRRIVQLRTDPARIGVWVQLRSLLVSLQFCYRPVVVQQQSASSSSSKTATTTTMQQLHCVASRRVPMRASTVPPRWCAGPTSVVTLDFDTSELIVWDISGSSAVVQAHIPVSGVPRPPKDAGSAALTASFLAAAQHITLHFGGDRVDTIMIFNGAARLDTEEQHSLMHAVRRRQDEYDQSGTIVAGSALVVAVPSPPASQQQQSSALLSSNVLLRGAARRIRNATRATATWLDLSHEERRHALQSHSRCTRASRFDASTLAAHDPAALMLQPATDGNKFYSWNGFKSRFDPSLRHMFAHSLCFFDSLVKEAGGDDDDGGDGDRCGGSGSAADCDDRGSGTNGGGGSGRRRASSLTSSPGVLPPEAIAARRRAKVVDALCVAQEHHGGDGTIVASQLLEMHTFETSDAGTCVFALLRLTRRAKAGGGDEAAGSSSSAVLSTSYLATAVSAKDNRRIDQVEFPLPCVPVEHAGPFIGTSGSSSQINSLHLAAPILSAHGVGAVAFEGAAVFGGGASSTTAADAAAAALISSLNATVTGGVDAASTAAAAAAAADESPQQKQRSTLNALIQRFAHRAAGATRVLCRINDWDDQSVRDATIALAAQNGAVALASELFGLLESDEDIASAVAACSTLHKLFALRFRELDLSDSAAREPFENLLLTAIRFAEQLTLKLFTHQQHFLVQQQQQTRSTSSNAVAPATRLQIGTVSEVRLVEQACKSDDLVLFIPADTALPTAAAAVMATDATSLVASLLEGWCRILDRVRSSAHADPGQQQQQQSQFADAILTRVADLRMQNQQQHGPAAKKKHEVVAAVASAAPADAAEQQQLARVVALVKKALKLIQHGRVSAAVQFVHQLAQLQQQQQQQQPQSKRSKSASSAALSTLVPLVGAAVAATTAAPAATRSAFGQARVFVDSVAAHVLSSTGVAVGDAPFDAADFATVVGCLAKAFPNRAERDGWLRAVILSTDSFVVRNRLVAGCVLLFEKDALDDEDDDEEVDAVDGESVTVPHVGKRRQRVLQRLADFFAAAGASGSVRPIVLSLIQECVARLGTDSAALRSGADFVHQQQHLAATVVYKALPRPCRSPVLFRAVEKRQRALPASSTAAASTAGTAPPSAVAGVVSSFPLRVLESISSGEASGRDNKDKLLRRMHLMATIERALFDMSCGKQQQQQQQPAPALLWPVLKRIAVVEAESLDEFAVAALSFAAAHLDFTLAACAGRILKRLRWPVPSAPVLRELLPKGSGANLSRSVFLAFAAACGMPEIAAAIVPRVQRTIALADAASPVSGDASFGLCLLQMINEMAIEGGGSEQLALRLAFQLFADSAPSDFVASSSLWLEVQQQQRGSSSRPLHADLAAWLDDETLIRSCVPRTLAEFLAVADAVLRRRSRRPAAPSSTSASLQLVLTEVARAFQLPPRGRALRQHAVAFADCCGVMSSSSSSPSTTSSSRVAAAGASASQADNRRAVFRAVSVPNAAASAKQTVSSSSSISNDGAAAVAAINEVVDGFVAGDVSKLRSILLTESCVLVLSDDATAASGDDDTAAAAPAGDDVTPVRSDKKRRGSGSDGSDSAEDESTAAAAAAAAAASTSAERARRAQLEDQARKRQEPRWITLLRQRRILAAAAEAKRANNGSGVSIEECLNACQDIFMGPAQLEQQQQSATTATALVPSSSASVPHLVAPLLTKMELAETHTLLFLIELGFIDYARSIYRSFQLGKEELASSSSSSATLDRASALAPWLCTICSDAPEHAGDGDDDDGDGARRVRHQQPRDDEQRDGDEGLDAPSLSSELRSRFRDDVKAHYWSRILQHAFAARLPPKFLFELLGAAPSLQAAVFPGRTVRAAATDGTSWGRKVCAGVNTRAFIRDMGAEQLQQHHNNRFAQSQQQQQQLQLHAGVPFARCILLSLNASRTTDQIATQLETFLTTTQANFAAALAEHSSATTATSASAAVATAGGAAGGLSLGLVAATLNKLFAMQPFPAAVAYRVVADMAENSGAAAAATSSSSSSSSTAAMSLTLAQLCVFIKHLADEAYDAAAAVATSSALNEVGIVDLLSACPAVADWLRSCVARLCSSGTGGAGGQQQQQQQAHLQIAAVPTGTLRSAASLFRYFPAIGERIYKSPHGAADAIVALDDALQETLLAITADEASQQRDRALLPRLETLLHVVARDLNRSATEPHLPADFTSKVWSACDGDATTATAAAGAASSPFYSPSTAAAFGMSVAATPSAGSAGLHAAAGVSSRTAGGGPSSGGVGGGAAAAAAATGTGRRFRNGEEVWRYCRDEFVEAALYPGSPWSSDAERGFFVAQIFQDWTRNNSSSSSSSNSNSSVGGRGGNSNARGGPSPAQQQQEELAQLLETTRRAGGLDERIFDRTAAVVAAPLGDNAAESSSVAAAAAAASAEDGAMLQQQQQQLFALLYSQTVPPLSETVFRKTSNESIAGLLVWLVAFAVPASELTVDVVLRLVSLRLAAIRARSSSSSSALAVGGVPGAAIRPAAAGGSSSGSALAEQRLRHVQTLVTALRPRMTQRLLYYVLTACMCAEVPELEVEGHLLRLQRDACPNFDDVIGGEKPALDAAMMTMFDAQAQGNFFFKQWIGKMFVVPRDALARFGSSAAAAAAAASAAGGDTEQQALERQQRDKLRRSKALAQMLLPFVGAERAEEMAAMSSMSVSNASNLLRDVLSTPCASWSDTVLLAPSSAAQQQQQQHAAAGASTTADESRHLLVEKIRVSDAILAALEKSVAAQTQQQLQQGGSSASSTQQDFGGAAASPDAAGELLLNPQQQATMLNLISNGIFAAWVVPLLGYRGGDDASRIFVWATRNLNVLSEAYQSAKQHFSAASEQFRVQAVSLHWTHEVDTLARLMLVLRSRHGAGAANTFPPLPVLLHKLFDLLARMEDALAGAVDDGCFAEAKLFLAAVGWRLVDESSSRRYTAAATTTAAAAASTTLAASGKKNSNGGAGCCYAVLPFDTALVSKVLDEADASLNALINRSELAPIGRFVLATRDAPWILTPVLHHLLQVGEYHGAFIAPLSVAASIAAPTTRSLTGCCTRLALLHYFLAASDFAVEVASTADMYSFFGHNAPLAEGFEFESWSMLLSLVDTQRKSGGGGSGSSMSKMDAGQQRKLDKLIDEVTASFEQSAEVFFRADLCDRAFNCVLVVRLLDALKRLNKASAASGSGNNVGLAASKIVEAALGGMAESMAQTLQQQGVVVPQGAAGGTSTPDVQRRVLALEAAKHVADPQALLLLGCGAEFNADEWARAIQSFVITCCAAGGGGGGGASKFSIGGGGSSAAAAAAASAGVGRVMELGRLFKNSCITVGADMPSRMRALMPTMQAGTQRTAWEELIAMLEKLVD